MSNESGCLKTSLSRLPPELLVMIAREVASLQARPSSDTNKTTMMGDWRNAVSSVKKLSQVNAFFRHITAEVYTPLALWIPYRAPATDHGPYFYEEYTTLLGKCNFQSKQRLQISQIPADKIRNLALTYDDLDDLYDWLERLIKYSWLPQIGWDYDYRRRCPVPLRNMSPPEIRLAIMGFDRMHPLRNILWMHPSESVTFLTILLEDGEAAGWDLPSWRTGYLRNATRSFRRGSSLYLPSPKQIDRASGLLLFLFPSLLRVTIVRRRFDLDEEDNWHRYADAFAPNHTSYYEMRKLFGGESCEERYPLDPHGKTPPSLPTFIGRSGVKFLQFEGVKSALFESDEMFLRCVHAKIAKRDAG